MRELEFLPEEYLRARFQRRIGFIRSWLLLAIGLAMVLYSMQMGTWVRDARAELRALQGTGTAVKGDVEKVRRLREEARTYSERIEVAEALQPRTTVTAVLADLVAALPEAVCVERLEVLWPADDTAEPATVRLEGAAGSEKQVTLAVARLDASPRFGRTILVESRLAEEAPAGGRTFALETRVIGVDAEQGESP
ncbi:MAG: PilN domain-containing protein [Phycisphaerae bacterium]